MSMPDLTPLVIDDAELADRLREHARHAEGALSPNTLRALRADSTVWTAWCSEHGHCPAPATTAALVAFVDDMAETKAVSTVRRYVASIAHMHRAAGATDSTKHEHVRLALKRMARAKGTRQKQAAGLNRALVDHMLAVAGDRLIDDRNKALLAVSYDTLCRRSELVAIEVGDISHGDDGSGTVLVSRSKGDQEGEGSVRYLAPDTIGYVRGWLDRAGISEGRLFRSVGKGGGVGERLSAGEVSKIFKKMVTAAGADAEAISGHSARVGAAQDLTGAGIELAAIMQAGGWKSPAMPARYGEKLQARRGAMAKLAATQDR
jgi:site-specific recombinase XerD